MPGIRVISKWISKEDDSVLVGYIPVISILLIIAYMSCPIRLKCAAKDPSFLMILLESLNGISSQSGSISCPTFEFVCVISGARSLLVAYGAYSTFCRPVKYPMNGFCSIRCSFLVNFHTLLSYGVFLSFWFEGKLFLNLLLGCVNFFLRGMLGCVVHIPAA